MMEALDAAFNNQERDREKEGGGGEMKERIHKTKNCMWHFSIESTNRIDLLVQC